MENGDGHQRRIVEFFERCSSRSSVINSMGASNLCSGPLLGAQDPGGGLGGRSRKSPGSKPGGGMVRIKKEDRKRTKSVLEMWKLKCKPNKNLTGEYMNGRQCVEI